MASGYSMIDNSLDNDFKWLICIQGNDEQALASLMRKYYMGLYLYALKFTTNEELIRKCILDVFMSLWQKRSLADKIHSPQNYLFTSTKDKLTQDLRKKATTNH